MKSLIGTAKLSKRLHAGQSDKGGADYYLHPVSVMLRIPNATEHERHLALLHDVLEDTDMTAAGLLDLGYSPELLSDLAVLTKLPGERYVDYIDRIATSGSPAAIRVKVADLEDNLDPERLALIDTRTAESLRRRYSDALSILYVSLRAYSPSLKPLPRQ